MERWRGKVAVVTGASAGIGLAIAQELVKYGVITVALSRRPHLVEAIKPQLKAAESSILHAVKCDITNEEEVVATFQWIKKNLKSVHILINNAGVLTVGTLLDGPSANWKKTIDVNVTGLCLITKEGFALMRDTGVTDGHIINVNSLAGHKVPALPSPTIDLNLNIYPATKHAVTALTKTLQNEINARKLPIKVTSLSPGLVKTEIFKANDVFTDEKIFDNAPSIEGIHIAEAAIYILSTPPAVNITELTIQPTAENF